MMGLVDASQILAILTAAVLAVGMGFVLVLAFGRVADPERVFRVGRVVVAVGFGLLLIYLYLV